MNSIAKKMFITGGTGYIGKGVVKEFLANNYQVIALSRDENKAKELEQLGASCVIGGLEDVEKMENAAKGVDTIIHCARDYYAENANELDIKCIEVFLKAAKENAKTQPCTFIYTSGCLCLGEGDDVKDEFSKIDKAHEFAKWRLENESKVLEFADSVPNLTCVVMRPSWIYGGGSGLVSDYLKVCKKNNVVYYTGTGESYCNYLHVDDLAKFYYLLAEKNKSGIFHGTDNKYLKISEVTEALKNYLKAESQHVSLDDAVKLYGFTAYSQVIDQKMVTKRAEEIGWTPTRHSLLDNIEQLFKELS